MMRDYARVSPRVWMGKTGRCAFVTWPAGCKDANDVLVQYGAETLRECLAQATPWPLEDVVQVRDVAERDGEGKP